LFYHRLDSQPMSPWLFGPVKVISLAKILVFRYPLFSMMLTLLFSRFFLGGSGILKNYISPTMDPEVVILFLEPELRSEDLSVYASSFTNLKNLLKTEKKLSLRSLCGFGIVS